MQEADPIRRALARHAPRLDRNPDKNRAAVAAILHRKDRKEHLLYIERSNCQGDPWSGHIAFPGGKIEASDATPRRTAERETLEEIGLDLETAHYLGRLDDLTGATLPILVSGFVYRVNQPPPPRPNAEVKEAFWIPFEKLAAPERQTEFRLQEDGPTRIFPAIDLLGPGRPLLWGLTYRFTAQLLHLAGYLFPPNPDLNG